jgi:hypothetical protein
MDQSTFAPNFRNTFAPNFRKAIGDRPGKLAGKDASASSSDAPHCHCISTRIAFLAVVS